ncbi:hypothetical protein LTY56_09985 [Limosilactobacillus albertensis]|nr:hypothetical protein [Limosilactobacillus albertensis]MCD7118941.1 hypothetical protein [Limosilactobacillus albertensis]MCD7125492.1 hypothetical protein [Limosilactobacillus caviae]MCD7129079.1 hypothetical protein [Limosilactobacillus albertensis]MRH47274.1 hypothetical protein [Limosilactobacillus reuteri]
MWIQMGLDLNNQFYQEINRQNTFYFWIIGIVLTVSIAITAFFGVLQWRLSDKQIEKMKIGIKEKLINEYDLDKLENRLAILNNQVNELMKKQEQLTQVHGYILIKDIHIATKKLFDENPEVALEAQNSMIICLKEFLANKYLDDLTKAVSLSFVYRGLKNLDSNNIYVKTVLYFMSKNANKYLNVTDFFQIDDKIN